MSLHHVQLLKRWAGAHWTLRHWAHTTRTQLRHRAAPVAQLGCSSQPGQRGVPERAALGHTLHRWQGSAPRHCSSSSQAVPLPEVVTSGMFAASTLYTAALGLLMVLAPRWERTKQLMQSLNILLPLAAAYGVLLLCSWESDTFSLILPGSWEEGFKGGFNPQFFPELSGIMALFSRLITAASLWVHLLAVNLFAARAVYLQGLEESIPTWHSILLCLTLSPLGLLSHFFTKAVWKVGGSTA